MQTVAEDIERAALEELHAVASDEVRQNIGLSGRHLGSAFVSIATELPASAIVINRAIGVGLHQPETAETIDAMVEAYQSKGVERYFIQVHPGARPETIPSQLAARGLEKARGWQKFSRGREPIDPPKTELSIKEVGPENGADLAVVLSDAFDLGDVARPWIAQFPSCDHWHVFMTFDGESPAGTGSVYIDGDCAWMDFGATAPQYRKRGSQSSLLRHRVQYALDHGCKHMFTCTGEDVPGDPQHSYTNILRSGFKEDYVRANYAPPKP